MAQPANLVRLTAFSNRTRKRLVKVFTSLVQNNVPVQRSRRDCVNTSSLSKSPDRTNGHSIHIKISSRAPAQQAMIVCGQSLHKFLQITQIGQPTERQHPSKTLCTQVHCKINISAVGKTHWRPQRTFSKAVQHPVPRLRLQALNSQTHQSASVIIQMNIATQSTRRQKGGAKSLTRAISVQDSHMETPLDQAILRDIQRPTSHP